MSSGGVDGVKVVFMGSPDFAVPSLRAVHGRYPVVGVVTQPDRPQGRGQRLAPPPVKVAALELGLPVLQPEKLRVAAVREQIAALGADLFVVAAYGKILSPRMLAVPRLGCINVHASLLPRLRGAAPIQWAVINREPRSGITIMKMDEGMDTGPMLLQRELELRPEETAGSLHDRLAPLGAEALLAALPGYLDGSLAPVPQPADGATLASMLTKDHGRVDFSLSAAEIDGWIRGLDPWPGAYTDLPGGERLRLFVSTLARGQSGPPGQVLAVDTRGLLVACGEDAVWIRELQLAGRKRMLATALHAGRPLPAGTRLGA
jgi:methionyl-tRNA formyltransferase